MSSSNNRLRREKPRRPGPSRKFHWLSIEGSGSSVLPTPMTRAEMLAGWLNTAWAEQVIGLPTAQERDRLHRICLDSPMEAVEEEMAKLGHRVRRGEVDVVTLRERAGERRAAAGHGGAGPSPGVSPADDPSSYRRDMLECQLGEIRKQLARARSIGVDRPFVLVGDTTDFHGRELAMYAFRSTGVPNDKLKEEFEARFAGVEGVPTIVVIVPYEEARVILPQTSPTALKNVMAIEALRRPGLVPVAVIARKGNSYSLVPE
jgi:hypothetical protein